MIKVAFIINHEWKGVLHYLKNLIYAISRFDSNIEVFVILGYKTDKKIIDMFSSNSKIIYTSILDRKTISWFIYKIIHKFTGSHNLLSDILKKNKIDIVSHSAIIGKNLPYKVINFIPDFQHIHLTEMFSEKDLAFRNKSYMDILKNSDLTILSSNDSYNDCKIFAKHLIQKVRVLPFVSQTDENVFISNNFEEIEQKYSFNGKFFFLPNQFWKHKNHMVVFKAVKLLKSRGFNILVLCSGQMYDNRNIMFMNEITEYIEQNGLNENIKLLGLIDYKDVLFLIRNSISVINPSLFEGWSSTVEEAKSIGKNLILSNINIHIEQNPPETIYFNPKDEYELSNILLEKWLNNNGGPDCNLEEQAKISLNKRTFEFAMNYKNIIQELSNDFNKN